MTMHIILGVDGSQSSLEARDMVAGLPWPSDATVTLMAAYQVPVDWTGGVASRMAWVGDAADAVRDQLGANLRSLGEPLAARGWTVKTTVIEGRPASALVDAAAEERADLIVVGSRGHGRVGSMLLGSVSAEVVSVAPCPVLVVRGAHLTHAMIAADGSPSARSIPGIVGGWGVLRGVRTNVLSVATVNSPAYELIVGLYTLGSSQPGEERASLLTQCQAEVDEMVGALAAVGVEAAPHVRSGDAANEILSAASEWGVDLIVTGSRGLSGFEQVLLGSVARNVVLHAPCSVLVIRQSR